jgi:hypothetical protein
VRQYTVEQQRKIDAINSSRAKIAEGVANGTYTEHQGEQLNQQLDMQYLGISQLPMKAPETAEQAYRKGVYTTADGIELIRKANGDWMVSPEYAIKQEALKVSRETAQFEQEQEAEQAEFAFKARQAENDFYLAAAKEFGPEEASRMTVERFPAKVPTEQEQRAEAARNAGVTPEQFDADIAAKQEQLSQGQSAGQPQESQPSPAEGLYNENTPENQEAIVAFYKKRESERRLEAKRVSKPVAFSPTGPSVLDAFLNRKKHGAQNLSQFLQEYDRNPALREEVYAEIYKERIKTMKPADWETAYKEYEFQNPGNILPYSNVKEFKAIMRKDAGELSKYFRL